MNICFLLQSTTECINGYMITQGSFSAKGASNNLSLSLLDPLSWVRLSSFLYGIENIPKHKSKGIYTTSELVTIPQTPQSNFLLFVL